jgi:dipeptidyl-peptidase-4
VAGVHWTKYGPPLVLLQNRAQKGQGICQIDPVTAQASQLLGEGDDAWLNIHDGVPIWLNPGKTFLWVTEQRGEPWLAEYPDKDGFNLVAYGGFKRLLHVDQNSKSVYLVATDDPTQTQLQRIDYVQENEPLRWSNGQILTKGDGLHTAVFAEKSDVYVVSSNMIDGRRESVVLDRDWHQYGKLRSVAEEPPFVPKLEIAKVGALEFRAAIIRPRNFNPKLKYPVIDSVYGGPGSQTVQAAARNYLLQQWIADHGFIVVSIDGRGTPSRGRDWERAIKGNLIEIPLADQVAGLKALGEKYPEMDMSRVGIYGWSFGGYFSAMAVMRRPDVFKVAVAGAPVCDWRDYDTHYTERYLGLPDENPAGYDASSVLTYCKDLERPLLIIHGTADDNVYFMHALKMSNALFRAGKNHELLPLSDFTHMVSDPLVTRRTYEKIMDFLAKNLRG